MANPEGGGTAPALDAFFSSSPDAIIVVDQSGTIVMSSPSVTELFGYEPAELISTPLDVLLPIDRVAVHATRVASFFDHPHARQMGAGLELAGRHRDEHEFAVDVSLAPVTLRGQSYAAAFVRDATDRQRALHRLHAINDVTQSLLGGAATRDVLPTVAARARVLLRADAAWIVMPSVDDRLEIVVADGPSTSSLVGTVLSSATSRSASVMRTGTSDVIEDLATSDNVPVQCAELGLGPGLYVPLTDEDQQLGALVIGRSRGDQPFTSLDVAFVETFAASIASAMLLGVARSEIERLGIVSEDERIARDLHDTVIQRLFAVGMSLQATRRMTDGAASTRIDTAIDDLDAVIKEIRNTIFQLPGHVGGSSGIRTALLEVAERSRGALGFSPRMAFDGPVDTAVNPEVVDDARAVLVEILANVARHAHATSVEVVVAVDDQSLTITVVDDGTGMDAGPSAGNGLRNMSARAAQFGGECTFRSRDPHGTIIEWTIPI